MHQDLSFIELANSLADEDQARELLEKLRWQDGAVCPHCDAEHVYKIVPKEGSKTRQGLWKCGICRKQFTVTVGTILEGSRIPIGKWLMAIHLMCASKKGISALQLQRNLGISTYKTAWFMCHRIRLAMSQEPLFTKLRNTVEADETYIGGKVGNMHAVDRDRVMQGRKGGSFSKAPVVTLVEREGRVKTHHMEHVTSTNIKRVLRECVNKEAYLMTDEAPQYFRSEHMFLGHESVNHNEKEYVRGQCHVNTAESVHALLKRGVMGTYHHWSKKHLHRYLNEFDFRWNFRNVSDSERTLEAIKGIEGKKLRYKKEN